MRPAEQRLAQGAEPFRIGERARADPATRQAKASAASVGVDGEPATVGFAQGRADLGVWSLAVGGLRDGLQSTKRALRESVLGELRRLNASGREGFRFAALTWLELFD